MENTIELPAETNPLNQQTLLEVLNSATSGKSQQVQSSTKQLQEWETKSGFYSLLQEVFIANTASLDTRLLSLIQLKNGIDKYWRKSANNAIPADDRINVRSRILESGIQEANQQLVVLNAICTGKVARCDFPAQWPNLFKQLISMMRSALSSSTSLLHLSNTLTTTHYIVKELATVRLQRSKASLFAITPELFAVLQDVYLFSIREWQQKLSVSPQRPDEQVMSLMTVSVKVLKILRRLVIAGYEFPHRESEVQEYWSTTQSHLQIYLELLHRPGLTPVYQEAAGQHINQLAKFHCSMADEHSVSFALLPSTMSLVRNYWSAASMMRERQIEASRQGLESMSLYEGICLRALLLLRACFKIVFNPAQNFRYKNAEAKEDPPKSKKLVSEELLTDEFILDLAQIIINRFFLYTPGDVEEWISEPEEWEMKEEGDDDAYDRFVRPCAERLFLDIVLNFKDQVTQPLLNAWQLISNPSNTDVFAKDTIYSAIGLSGPALYERMDFNQYLTTTIVAELQNHQANHNVMRRRIAIVIAQWITIDIAEANKPLVYQIFQHLMDPSITENDQAVRITAGKRFKDIANDWHFKAEHFAPYAANIITQLVNLIQEVNLAETKMAMLYTLGIVVERMETGVVAFGDQIMTLLPSLWEGSGNEHLMKQAIVGVLRKLVTAMGVNSVPMHSMVLPIIQGALEPGSETQVYLLEDALDLWSAILTVARAPLSPQLLSLFPLVFDLFDMESESPAKALRITESYLISSPSEMLQASIRIPLMNAFSTLLAVKSRTIIDLTRTNIVYIIRASEVLGGEQGVNTIASSMLASGVLPKIFESLYYHWESNQVTGPKRTNTALPQDWRNETDYFIILARLVLGSTSAFVRAIESWVSSRAESFDQAMSSLLDELFNHADGLDPSTGKLVCLAATKLLETGQPWILSRLQELITLWTTWVTTLSDEDEDGAKVEDTLVYKPLTEAPESPEGERRRNITYTDPVHTINIRHYIKHHLSIVITGCGGEHQFQEQWLQNVDKDVVKAFSELGIM